MWFNCIQFSEMQNNVRQQQADQWVAGDQGWGQGRIGSDRYGPSFDHNFDFMGIYKYHNVKLHTLNVKLILTQLDISKAIRKSTRVPVVTTGSIKNRNI